MLPSCYHQVFDGYSLSSQFVPQVANRFTIAALYLVCFAQSLLVVNYDLFFCFEILQSFIKKHAVD
jgi:hypothetical protein